jgi:hypothetical protein
LLAVLVFGSIAWASHEPGHLDQYVNVDTQQVTLGPGGSVVVSGTIVCEEGFFLIFTTVRQRSVHNEYNTASNSRAVDGPCTGSPVAWETDPFVGSSPYHPGSVSVVTDASAWHFHPDGEEYHSGAETEIEDLRIRR